MPADGRQSAMSEKHNPTVDLRQGSDAVFSADEVGDLTTLATLLSVEPIQEWPPLGGEHDADASRFFRSALTQDPQAAPWLAHYVCVANQLVGSAGFFGPPQDGATEIGISICERFRNRGIATATVRALIDKAEASGLTHLTARIRPNNVPSIIVFERNGFQVSNREPDADGFLLHRKDLVQ
jgi:[ribosomal protein S5]-alanine N-acetyltransferase